MVLAQMLQQRQRPTSLHPSSLRPPQERYMKLEKVGEGTYG